MFGKLKLCYLCCIFRVHSMLDDLRGSAVECVSFKTLCCEPDTPSLPKLHSRTVSSITVKWNVSIFWNYLFGDVPLVIETLFCTVY